MLFDGETTFGWKIDGEAKVEDHALVLGGDKETTARATTGFDQLQTQFEFRTQAPREGSGAPSLSWWNGGPSVKFPPAKGDGAGWGHGALHIGAHNEQCELRPAEGAAELLRRDLPSGRTAGPAHITFHVPAGTRLWVRNLRLKPEGLKSIFNGKDLTGWKEVKTNRTKSQFTVTDKGELNIKNGPGDLHTEGQWDDFVLQLDVFSNGEHLNSGVFFRCLPDEFWSGYEAQIRNQWKDDDRTKAVDYGTGGIYNRQPARKVVSSDKEWFTMTIAAEGNHLAVWVNGYQTADYTDTRPPHRSARNGNKIDKGTVSLQGHDPTTDLSFRNIRIAELPRAGK
jgi:hypothetical protein